MQATYSFQEIKTLIRTLDYSSINILRDLVEEEKDCFSEHELRAFSKFLRLKNKTVVRNQVEVEFLLSYN